MTNAEQRTATARGAMLSDPEMLGNSPLASGDAVFEPAFWAARAELSATSAGRGAAWFIHSGGYDWVLRHSRRGGLLAPLTGDCYVWAGEARVRTFAEWRVLKRLNALGLPVPKPVGARYIRSGLIYRCDLITERIRDARPLSAALAEVGQPEAVWREIGAAISRLHAAGADHADLNAHNVLVGSAAAGAPGISIIDFDRARLRKPGPWRMGNLARLFRSLEKISKDLPPGRFSARERRWLESGYASS